MKKTMNHRKATGALVISALAILSGCGSNPQAAPPVAPAPAAVVPGVGVPGGCVPLNAASQIGFTATGMNFFNNRVQAGYLKPINQTVGVITLTPGAVGLPGQPVVNPTVGYGYGQTYRGTNYYSGTQIILSVGSGAPVVGYNPYMPQTGAGYGQTTGSGTISLGASFAQGLMQRAYELSAGGAGATGGWFPGTPSYGYPSTYPQTGVNPAAMQSACLSGVGLDLSATLYSGQLINGSAYFYLNGTQNGLALDF